MVQIANPIYDVVFKYLMKDEKVAKLLLSAIIGREVVSLDFRPTEHSFPVGEVLTVMRMDFSARIQDKDGKLELVILELQKAKFHTDILRFRRYLGEQYISKDNVVMESGPEIPYRRALPILSIYFLGHSLDHVKAPVVRVNRTYTDAATGEKIEEKEEFIESLTHDSIIIQIPLLKGRRRTELEQLLALFDQSNTAKDYHILNINDDELPERYRPLVRRLQMAIADPDVRQTMSAEDDLIEELQEYQRLINEKDTMLKEKDMAISEKDMAISEKDMAISEKDMAISEKDMAISEKDMAISEKDMAISEKDMAISEKDMAISEKDMAISEKDMAISEKDKAISEKDMAISEKDMVISEKDMAISEKDMAISEKDKAISEKDMAISEKDKAISEKESELAMAMQRQKKAIKELYATGMDTEKIAAIFGLSISDIDSLMGD